MSLHAEQLSIYMFALVRVLSNLKSYLTTMYEQIYGALEVMNDADIDRPLGNPAAMDDVVKTYTSRTAADTTVFTGASDASAVHGSYDHASGHVQRSGRGAGGSDSSVCADAGAFGDSCASSVAVTE